MNGHVPRVRSARGRDRQAPGQRRNQVEEKSFDALARDIGTSETLQRRRVLGGAGAALALMLGGILTSGSLEEAEAGDGKKKKKKRKKNKNQQPPVTSPPPGNADDPPGLGGDSWIYVRIVVENQTDADIDFEGLALYEENQKICRTKALQTIHPHEAVTFAPMDSNGFPTSSLQAVLNDKYLVSAAQEQGPHSDFPAVWASSTLHDSNIVGCKVGNNEAIFNKKMGVGQMIPFTMEGQKFELLRENDIEGARLFRLRVKAS